MRCDTIWIAKQVVLLNVEQHFKTIHLYIHAIFLVPPFGGGARIVLDNQPKLTSQNSVTWHTHTHISRAISRQSHINAIRSLGQEPREIAHDLRLESRLSLGLRFLLLLLLEGFVSFKLQARKVDVRVCQINHKNMFVHSRVCFGADLCLKTIHNRPSTKNRPTQKTKPNVHMDNAETYRASSSKSITNKQRTKVV